MLLVELLKILRREELALLAQNKARVALQVRTFYQEGHDGCNFAERLACFFELALLEKVDRVEQI